MIKSQSNRFEALDAMRGIAALLDVWHHTAEYFIKNMTPDTSDTLMFEAIKAIDPGRIGVICFFLISGFIIPSSFSKSSKSPISEFTIKRVFRLYPAYWLSIVLAIFVDALFLSKEHSCWQALSNATMIQNLLGQDHIQGLYWTLQVELIFYVLCAFMFRANALQTSKQILLALTLSLFIFSLTNLIGSKLHLINKSNKEIFYTPFLLGVMLCGTLLRTWIDQNDKKNLISTSIGFSLVFSIPILNYLLSANGIHLIADAQRFLISHIIGLIIFLAAITKWNSPPKSILRIGAVSYSLYLFHPIVMHLLGYYTNDGWMLGIIPPNLALQTLIATLIAYLLSEATQRYIETPYNNIARDICKQRYRKR